MRWSSVRMLLAIDSWADTASGDAGPVPAHDAGRAPDAATVDAAIATGQVAYVIQGERTPVPADDLGSGRWLLPLPQGEQPVMLRIDARWVPRWWERP